jgi:hypothetical protein
MHSVCTASWLNSIAAQQRTGFEMEETYGSLFTLSLLLALVIVVVLPICLVWFSKKPRFKPTKID